MDWWLVIGTIGEKTGMGEGTYLAIFTRISDHFSYAILGHSWYLWWTTTLAWMKTIPYTHGIVSTWNGSKYIFRTVKKKCGRSGCFLYWMPLIPLLSKPPPPAAHGQHSLSKQIIAGRTGAHAKPSGTAALTPLQPESWRKWLRLYSLCPDRPGDPRNKAFPSTCDWSDFPVSISEATRVAA